MPAFQKIVNFVIVANVKKRMTVIHLFRQFFIVSRCLCAVWATMRQITKKGNAQYSLFFDSYCEVGSGDNNVTTGNVWGVLYITVLI